MAEEKWEVAHCAMVDVDGYLRRGWEPFAVTVVEDGVHIVWFRRLRTPEKRK